MSVSSCFSHMVLSYIPATPVVTSHLLIASKNYCRNIWKKPGFHISQTVKGGKCSSCLLSCLNTTQQGQSCMGKLPGWKARRREKSPLRNTTPEHSPTQSSIFCIIVGPQWRGNTFTSYPWPLVANLRRGSSAVQRFIQPCRLSQLQ